LAPLAHAKKNRSGFFRTAFAVRLSCGHVPGDHGLPCEISNFVARLLCGASGSPEQWQYSLLFHGLVCLGLLNALLKRRPGSGDVLGVGDGWAMLKAIRSAPVENCLFANPLARNDFE